VVELDSHGKRPRYQLNRRLGGLQRRSGLYLRLISLHIVERGNFTVRHKLNKTQQDALLFLKS
jgi:hypothetical protein